MKIAFSALLVAAHTLSSVCAAPQFFVSEYEDDAKGLTQSSRKSGGTLVDRLRDDKRFSRFVEVLEKERGLRDDLENRDKETTIFAPTNTAFEHIEKQWANDENKPEMRDILKYHIAPDSQISGDALHAGALIPTAVRMKELGDRHQRIRVFRFHGEVWLNMMSRIVEKDIEAENGRIHAVDRVLVPPQSVSQMLYTMPSTFSTFLVALERTGLAKQKEKAVTVFTPSNRAWENLGFDNLRYLFSCVGQKTGSGSGTRSGEENWCQGTKDLLKIVKYHVATQLAYSTDMMQKETMKMDTLDGSKLTVCSMRRENEGRDMDDEKHKDVRKYNFVINNGEARVQFTDGLASNGAIQVIDNVLIPKDVKLPHDKWVM